MKQSIKYLLLASLSILAACTHVETDVPSGDRTELIALLESDLETKTYLSGPDHEFYYPCWSGEEKIAVYSGREEHAERFSFVSGKGTRQATFSGAASGESYLALYPYGIQGERKGNTLTITLPAEQEYVPGSFGEGAFPMVASSPTSTLSFRNLCSVLRIPLTGKTQVQSISFKVHDPSLAVSGQAVVQVEESGDPVLTMAEDASSSVMLNCPDVQLSPDIPTDFFLVIPPGTYKGGFSLKIKTAEGTVMRSTERDVDFGRSRIRSIPVFECSGGEFDPEDLPSNVILYKTESGWELDMSWRFPSGPAIISNTYENGQGKVVFDGSLTMIGDEAFNGSEITEIILPNTVRSIGEKAFRRTLIKSFQIPANLTELGRYAFAECEYLKRFTGPLTLKDGTAIVMDNEIVSYIGDVGDVISIPEGIFSIRAFSIQLADAPKKRVREVILPEGFISVNPGNFSDLPNLEYVTLPSTYRTTWQGTFSNCPNLKQFKGTCPEIYDNGNLLVDNLGYVSDFAGAGIVDYVIPEGVKYLENEVFTGKNSLFSLTFPESFAGVINRPFYDAPNLTFFYGKNVSADGHSLVVDGTVIGVTPAVEYYTSPKGASVIGGFLFENQHRKITFDDGVREIGPYALEHSYALQTLILSASLQTVEREAFAGFTTELKEVYFRSKTPPFCESMTRIRELSDDLVVYVPEESLEAYRKAGQWYFFRPYMKGYKVPDAPESPSLDGKVVSLQNATEGRGIDLVLMGDAFTQEQIEDGSYGAVMRKMMNAFFSVEPYRSYRNLFNVYQVNVVSQRKGYGGPGQALGTSFVEGTKVKGDDKACMNYARNAISNSRMDNVLILVAMDTTAYAGTCYMYNSSAYQSDWGEGTSVAYFPLGETDETLSRLVHHEAGGHGFAKLADEYSYESQGAVTPEEISETLRLVPYGWWKNIDFTSDPAQVKWARFLRDDRYRNEDLGVFEGGLTYLSGVWRPSRTSIMLDNSGGFNAPSREAIWYRLHKLAYGKNLQYNYEDFVAYDAMNRKQSAAAPSLVPQEALPPLPAPVVIHRSWEEVVNDK